jgi:hypothetical protein
METPNVHTGVTLRPEKLTDVYLGDLVFIASRLYRTVRAFRAPMVKTGVGLRVHVASEDAGRIIMPDLTLVPHGSDAYRLAQKALDRLDRMKAA